MSDAGEVLREAEGSGRRAVTGTDQATVSRDAWAVGGFAPLPGDVVLLPDDLSGNVPSREHATVETVYLCSESNGLELIHWSWIVLTDGRLLEIAPRGCALYNPPTPVPHGSGTFLELAAQDGALVRFEERVRAGVWQARPVRLSLGGRRWRLTSTGTVTAQRLGPVPANGWGQLRTGSAAVSTRSERSEPSDQDVYFTLIEQVGEQAGGKPDGKMVSDSLGLGIWMTDICYAFGRRLGDSPAAAGLRIAGGADQSSPESSSV